MAVTAVGGRALGWYFDTRVETLPAYALAGLAAGIAAACCDSYVQFSQYWKD
jgi:hypothetical protein